MTLTPVVDLPIVECVAKRLMDACQILPGHENTFKRGAARTWMRGTEDRFPVGHDGKSPPQRQFYKSFERLVEMVPRPIRKECQGSSNPEI
jgi:hypothetical protein